MKEQKLDKPNWVVLFVLSIKWANWN